VNEIVAALMELVSEITEGEVRPDPGYTGPDSIRRLGLNSLLTLNFLVTVEDTYGIEWDDDLPEEVLASFELMAGYIARQRAVAYAP
jgi:acyl carrier protein